MGDFQYISTEQKRMEVLVKDKSLDGDIFSVIEVLDFIEQFTNDIECDTNSIRLLTGYNGITIEEYRFETDKEYTARWEKIRTRELAAQQANDKTWARQKARFAKARRKKDAKAISKET